MVAEQQTPLPQASVADRLDVQEVLMRYTYAIDARDYDAVRSCFVPSAKIDYETLPAFPRGPEDFVETVRHVLDQLASTQHLVANMCVTVDQDRAHCTSYVQASHVTTDGKLFVGAGRYDDDLERTPDGWKIAARTHRRQWSTDPHNVAATLGVRGSKFGAR